MMPYLAHKLSRARVLLSALVLVFLLLNALRTLQQSLLRNPHVPTSAHVEPIDRLARQLAQHLPPAGRIGLLLDSRAGVSRFRREHYAMQYALAPRVLLIVGDVPPQLFAHVEPPPVFSASTPDIVVSRIRDPALLEAQRVALQLTTVGRVGAEAVILCRTAALHTPACALPGMP